MIFNRRALLTGLAALPLIAACSSGGAVAAGAGKLPAPTLDAAPTAGLQKVVLAGGCFWGIQGVYSHVNGVTRAVSGYSGGSAETATYDQVSSHRTGHAEAVEVTFDPAKISLGEILRVFFTVATDPTQLNRQDPDEGPQYRNEIFATTDEQAKVARAYIAQLGSSGAFKDPIVTKVSMLDAFYPAETYHQDYLFEHPTEPYIAIYDQPKLTALRSTFPDHWRAKPLLIKRA